MRQPPKLTEFHRYPIVAGSALLATGVTIAWWSKLNISPLFETAMIRRGELWRLVTNIFPHADIFHLAFNIYWLWVFGTLVEEVYGHLRTAALILLFAIGSSSLQFAFSSGGVGLSGVGYGLFGLLWILSKYDERFSDAVDQRTILLFVVWFIFCVVTTMAKLFPVANIAHAAGAVLGLLTATAIVLRSRRALAIAGIALVVIFGLWGSTLGRPMINVSDQRGYEEGQCGYDALMANNNEEAARWLHDAVVYQPKMADYWFDLGIAYARLGDNTSARAAYSKANQLEPNDVKYSEALKSFN